MSYADQSEASPSLATANCETVATFVRFWGATSVTSCAHQNKTSPSPGASNCETVATFEGSWEAQRSRVIRKSE